MLAGGSNSFKSASEMAVLTGDAEAMAYRAGAEITGKEFGSATFPSFARHPSWGRSAHAQWNPAFSNIIDAANNVLGTTHPKDDSRQEWTLGLESVVHEGRGPLFWDPSPATDEDMKRMLTWQAETHSPERDRAGQAIFWGRTHWKKSTIRRLCGRIFQHRYGGRVHV